MQRALEDVLRRSKFHNLAKVHHAERVRNVFHDGQIVRNEQIRESKLLLQIRKQVENLRLNGAIQCGNRLVANHKLRLERERPRNRNPLPLPAGKLVRIRFFCSGCSPQESITRSMYAW